MEKELEIIEETSTNAEIKEQEIEESDEDLSSGSDEESMLLSEAEKDELMSTLQDTVSDLQNESDRLNSIKDKTTKLGN